MSRKFYEENGKERNCIKFYSRQGKWSVDHSAAREACTSSGIKNAVDDDDNLGHCYHRKSLDKNYFHRFDSL